MRRVDKPLIAADSKGKLKGETVETVGVEYGGLGAPLERGVNEKLDKVNVTVVGPSKTGFLTLWPADIAWPGVATLTFNAGEPALGNGAIVPLGASTDMQMTYGISSGTATTHVVIDATGYFSVN